MDKNTRKTSFGQWVSPISKQFIEAIVTDMKTDRYIKKLKACSFLQLWLFAQLEEVESLHALSDSLFNDQLQREIGLHSISVSQLSRRLNRCDPAFFEMIFYDLVAQIHTKTHLSKHQMR